MIPTEASYLRGKRYNAEKLRPGNPHHVQNEQDKPSGLTSERLGEEYVSPTLAEVHPARAREDDAEVR